MYIIYILRRKFCVRISGVRPTRATDGATGLSRLVDEALGWLKKQQAKDAQQPFFMYVAFHEPHEPVASPKKMVAQYDGVAKNHNQAQYYANVTNIDAAVGKLMKALKAMKLDENTLVIFTSDNGPHQEGGHKMEFFNSNGELRGYKRDLYDGGIRVPMIARWPDKIKADSTSGHPSAFWDFLPTACELAGISAPEDTDGISYLSTLLGKSQPTHDYLFWRAGSKFAVRQGNWKAVRVDDKTKTELYDLSDDIGELDNLAEKHPELVSKFEAIMAKHRQ